MKGLSVFTSHILATAILFVILITVSSQMYAYYYNLKENVQRSESVVLSQRIANVIVKLHGIYKNSDLKPDAGENMTLSEIYLNIPKKISGNNYIIKLNQRSEFWIEASVSGERFFDEERPYTSIEIEIEGKPSSVYTYPVYNVATLNVSGSAKSPSGKIKISYVRKNYGGKIEDLVIMEEAE